MKRTMRTIPLLYLAALCAFAAPARAADAEQEATFLLQVEDFEGSWRRQTNIPDYLGSGFCTSNVNPKVADEPMRTTLRIERAGTYHVWVRAFQGGGVAANDRKRAVRAEVGDKRLGVTHDGEETGWSWQRAGAVALEPSETPVALHDADIGWESVDAVLLTLDASLDAERIEDWYGGASLRVLPDMIDDGAPRDMMKRYLTAQVDEATARWRKEFAQQSETREAIAARQKRLRAKFLDAIGEFPERTPLNARVTGTLQRKNYRVEKVLFESRPKHFVSALCFVPESTDRKGPYPGVLVPCGHTANAKAYGAYQTMGALLALNGMVALVFDPIDQGERLQIVDDEGRARYWGVKAHNRVGVAAAPLGWNTSTFEVWDGMRAIDYLQARPDVNGERIGCTGNSGGGTQTSQLMALDERIDASAVSCYLTSFDRLVHTLDGQDAEQNIYGQLAFGMDHADYITLRAPAAVLIAAGTRDFFDINGTRETFGHAKRLFERLGVGERVALFENDEGHNYNHEQRREIAAWMARFLADGGKATVDESGLEVFTDEELLCTPRGQVMLLPGARSVYDVLADRASELTDARKALWESTPREQIVERIRQLAGVRPLSELSKPRVETVATLSRRGYRVEKLIIHSEPGIVLPALRFTPKKAVSTRSVLYINELGKSADALPGGAIEKLLDAGRTVFAVDPRGSGETQQSGQGYFSPEHGGDGRDVSYAYLLGRSYVGMRAEDILVCARFLSEESDGAKGNVDMVAQGHAGVPALHAAALEPALFGSVKIQGMVSSWTDVASAKHSTNQMASVVYGALRVYDLPDLAALLGKKAEIHDTRDPDGRRLLAGTLAPGMRNGREMSR